ncbi:MAG: iron-sulfur cluster assembly accessory protein [Nitrospirae bacterium]|nr:iron-sulfur cluster assembly accessory protein [Nitrospirota bacterium]
MSKTRLPEMITVTQEAARQIQFSATKSEAESMALRIAARRGPQLEVQYQMGFDEPKGDDLICECEGIQFLVDEDSAPLLNGLVLDFGWMDGMMQFVFLNPNDTSEVKP